MASIRMSYGGRMASRDLSKSYHDVWAKEFEKPDYARQYFIYVMESEGLSVQQTLREAIKAMGQQNFACKSGLSARSVSDFVAQRRQWSLDKVSQHIKKVFKLELTVSIKGTSSPKRKINIKKPRRKTNKKAA